MIVNWMGYAMLCAATIGAFGACVERLLVNRRFPRRALWVGVLAASVLVPAALAWNAPPESAAPVATASVAVAPRVIGRPSLGPDAVTLVLWIVATLSAAAWLVVSQRRLGRLLAGCDHTRIDGVSVIVSPDFGPAVIGVVRPEIVVPSWVLSLGDTDRRLVLVHECEHMRGHDPVWQLAGLAIAVLAPWNLALWWQVRRLRLAIELDCDSRVVDRHRVHPARYGELLVRAHATAPTSTRPALALVRSKSTLARRIEALIGLPRRSRARVVGWSASGATLAALVVVAPAPPIRRAPPAPAIVLARTTTNGPPTPVEASPARQTPRVIARRRAPAATRVPPVKITPSSGGSIAVFAAPTVAPLPTMRPAGAIMAARGGVFARPVRPDSARAVGGFVLRASSDTIAPRGTAAAGAGGVIRTVTKPPTP